MKDLMSSVEACKELGINNWSIRRHLNNGQIKGIKVGRDWIIRKEEVIRLKGKIIDRRKIGALNGRWG